MPDPFIVTQLQNTVDTKKIQDLLKKAKVSILVGFPSGRVHVAAVHNIDEEGHRTGGSRIEEHKDREKAGQEIETWEIARDLYYGTAAIPARPFLTDGVEDKKDEIRDAIIEQVKKIKNDEKPNWKKVGTMAVGAIQEFVRGDYYKTNVPNGKETIELKGSDTPLIDSGDLMNSLAFIVEK